MEATLAILNELEAEGLIQLSPSDYAALIFERKSQGRRKAAALPIEEKLRRLVEMQRRANEIRQATDRPQMRVWELS